jgi:hypothetical protein
VARFLRWLTDDGSIGYKDLGDAACAKQDGWIVDSNGGSVTVNGDAPSTDPTPVVIPCGAANCVAPAGSGGGGNKQPQTRAPNNINCNTKLPNGQTVGTVVRQQRARLQQAFDEAAAQAQTGSPSNPLGYELGAFTAIAGPNGPIDFKKGQSGATFVQMGLAGNFAYYAIGSGYFSPNTLDAGAALYALTAAAFFPHSTVHFSDLTGHYFSDSAANMMKGPGLAANGSSVP